MPLSDARSRLRTALPALAVALVAIAAHLEALRNGFIQIDDGPYVTQNPLVRGGLSAQGIAWAFTAFDVYNWHPLTWISHMVDVSVWGLEPAGHHLTSLLLHAANAALVLLVLGRATGSRLRSAAVALLFAVHPVHVESVAWVAERKDVLSTFFLLCALLAYVGGGEVGPGARRTVIALALFALGLMAKPMILTMPLLLLAMDVWPLRRWEPRASARELLRLLRPKMPFFALAAASALVTVLAQNQGGKGAILYESPWTLNAGNALISYVRYLGLLAWPSELAIVHPFRASAITTGAVAAAGVALVGVTWAAVRLRARCPYLLFGWVWYVAALLPVAGFIRFGYHAYAERYLYIPAIGVYVAATWGVAEAGHVLGRWRRAALGAAAALVTAALAVVTLGQGRVWRSTTTVLEHAIRVHPDNPLPHRVLGSAYASLGNLDRAVAHTRAGRILEARDVVELHPEEPEAHHRLGAALADAGRLEEAIDAFRRSVTLDGARPRTWNSFGIALARAGRVPEARDAFLAALRIAPGDPLARRNLEILVAGGSQPAAPVPAGGAP